MTQPDTPPSRRAPFRHLDAGRAWDLIFERQAAGAEAIAVFDVRDEKAFDACHVEGAIRLADCDFPKVLSRFSKSTPMVIYCYHGHASQTFATTFSDFGFSEVYSVDGGFEALRTEHETRARAEAEAKPRALAAPSDRYLMGDLVFSRKRLHNDGGVPELAADALIAPAGARGVIVKVGHAEADPLQSLYVVRFEDAIGVLGPPVGCLPEELTQEAFKDAPG